MTHTQHLDSMELCLIKNAFNWQNYPLTEVETIQRIFSNESSPQNMKCSTFYCFKQTQTVPTRP